MPFFYKNEKLKEKFDNNSNLSGDFMKTNFNFGVYFLLFFLLDIQECPTKSNT